MENILITIALLCGNPSADRLSENDVLLCQQYYIKCYRDEIKKGIINFDFDKCVLNKISLGGMK